MSEPVRTLRRVVRLQVGPTENDWIDLFPRVKLETVEAGTLITILQDVYLLRGDSVENYQLAKIPSADER